MIIKTPFYGVANVVIISNETSVNSLIFKGIFTQCYFYMKMD